MAYTVVNGKLVRKGVKSRFKSMHQLTVESKLDRPKAMPKDKGQWNGHCNMSSCLAPGATWYNRGSYAFYCPSCARMLNRVNAGDTWLAETGGAPLCSEFTTQEEADNVHVSR